MIRFALFAGILSGCYRPSLRSCQYQCDSDSDHTCPTGLNCELSTNMCRDGSDGCGFDAGNFDSAIDGPPDGPPDPACSWNTPNIRPCFIGAGDATGDYTLDKDTTIDTGMVNGANPKIVAGGTPLPSIATNDQLIAHVEDSDTTVVAVLMVHAFEVPAGLTLTVAGDRPLIILADTIDIAGTITTTTTAACTGGAGKAGADAPSFADGASGGGGGSFGSVNAGSSGGDGFMGLAGGLPGSVVAPAHLIPLLGGCAGGAGGGMSGAAATRGAGGVAGGGLQLSAHHGVTITGSVNVGGRGGKGALGAGGGGGAGGGLLVDTFTGMINLANAHLCANGGGGGGGNVISSSGADATCSEVAAAGGAPGGGVGATGTASSVAGVPGAGSAAPSAEGGGGGCGVIILTTAPVTSTSNVITPPFTM